MYIQILGRCPESAASTYWTARLDAGLSRYGFAETLDMSDENVVSYNIEPLYDSILGRVPTQTEIAQWSTHLRTYHEDGMIVAALASSDEFYATVDGATAAEKDQAWLAFAYNGILDRDPDAAGASYFTGVLGTPSTAASRHLVASRLERSHENAIDWTGAVYGAAFNRPPDPSGFDYWVNWLSNGPGQWHTFQLWTHFLASNESYRIAQTQPNPPAAPTSGSAQRGAIARLARHR
jgi:hypothetical protein